MGNGKPKERLRRKPVIRENKDEVEAYKLKLAAEQLAQTQGAYDRGELKPSKPTKNKKKKKSTKTETETQRDRTIANLKKRERKPHRNNAITGNQSSKPLNDGPIETALKRLDKEDPLDHKKIDWDIT